MASKTCCSSSNEVRTSTSASESCFKERVVSMPEAPGSSRSISTTCGFSGGASFKASSPDEAVPTSRTCSLPESSLRSAFKIGALSSTAKTEIGTKRLLHRPALRGMIDRTDGDPEIARRLRPGRPAGSRAAAPVDQPRAPGARARAQPADLYQSRPQDGGDRAGRVRHGLHARRLFDAADRRAGVSHDARADGAEARLS